jgi:hypothetical protein
MADSIKTVSDIRAAVPCANHARERVAELVGDGLTAEQCAQLDIPAEDRLWAITTVWMDDRQRRLLACDCAERALVRERAAGREPDERSWAAVRVARAYARGEATDEELAAARTVAWYAVWDAAWAAAWEAAWAAAWEAAWAAAWDAAWAAARAAARYAAGEAWAAAWDAEREWQLERALAYVRGHYGLELEQCRLTGGEHE